MFDPATFREAARQLREEEACLRNEYGDYGAAWHLESLARRFDNEAKAAEAKPEVTP